MATAPGSKTTNLQLQTWGASNKFDYIQLAANWDIVDAHDHTGALGHGAKITNSAIEDSTNSTTGITTTKIADGAVTTAKLETYTSGSTGVTTAKLADNAVTETKLKAGILPVLSTTLPTSNLFDGYTVNLTDSTSSPNWVWKMRYTNSASRWEFVGGSWKQSSLITTSAALNTTSSVYANPSSNGITIQIPSILSTQTVTGAVFRIESFASGTTTSASNIGMSFAVGNNNASVDNEWLQSSPANGYFSGFRSSLITYNSSTFPFTIGVEGGTAGSTITAQFKWSAAASVTQHSLSIRPTYIDIA